MLKTDSQNYKITVNEILVLERYTILNICVFY